MPSDPACQLRAEMHDTDKQYTTASSHQQHMLQQPQPVQIAAAAPTSADRTPLEQRLLPLHTLTFACSLEHTHGGGSDQ